MKPRFSHNVLSGIIFMFLIIFCVLIVFFDIILTVFHGDNDLNSFTEPVVTMADGWTVTDSSGNSREITLPETIDYGVDGIYTLSCELPDVGGQLVSPAFRFYSNYVDLKISLDGDPVYTFPASEAVFSGATGNTYHFIRLPSDYAGMTVSIDIRCQLGDDITYLLNPALIGSKATMLKYDVERSISTFVLAGCMGILAIGLAILYAAFRKRLDLNYATLYTALFAMTFAVYVFCETSFAQLIISNGYMLCCTTLTLLAMLPIPLIGIFLETASERFKPIMYALMLLCSLNLAVQSFLNFTGVKSVRVMLPATHIVIIISITIASLCLIMSDKAEKPSARRALYSAIPMIIGGTVDIILLNINMPSANNCFWFAVGVVIFIVQQIYGYVSSYFALYRSSVETKMLSEMAYRDILAGIENRNAYERKLSELSEGNPSERLCCIVTDINGLKAINDTLGHQAGDEAIAAVGAILCRCMPENASYYRTGGDEFVILLNEYDEKRTRALAETLTDEVAQYGISHSIAISIATGYGQYTASDRTVVDFISRVDTLMYECKRKQKGLTV